jgi:NADH-quinone oxidoreductase subunit C/D
MFSWKEFEKTKNILSRSGGTRYRDDWGQHHISIGPIDLMDWMELLKDDLGFFTLSEIVGIDHGNHHFELVYHLLNMGTHQRLNVHVEALDGEVIPSVVRFFANAAWAEREQFEMLNIKFDEEKEGLLLPQGQKNFPLRKQSQTQTWPREDVADFPALRFNPNKSEPPFPEESYQWRRYDLLSPVTRGHFEWMVCFDPLKVVDSRPRIGFHHRGIEKLLETKNIFQTLQLVDTINLSSAPTYSITWAKTIEEMYRIKIPERAQAIRIIMLELARIADHLGILGTLCLQMKFDEYKHFLNAREKVCELFEKYSGHRNGIGVARIGGVQDDLPHGWTVEYQAVANVLTKNLRIVHYALISNTTFRSKLQAEPVNAQSVLQWGITGPAMRATGLNFDLRKSQPFYFYQDIDFDIPVGINGTMYDRYLIRFEEIFQSLRIITQVIDNLPLGDVLSQHYSGPYLELVKQFESFESPRQWHYCGLEGPGGETGFLVRFDQGITPARIKLKTPGFFMAQALNVFVKGLREDQLPTCLISLGLSHWEMDR